MSAGAGAARGSTRAKSAGSTLGTGSSLGSTSIDAKSRGWRDAWTKTWTDVRSVATRAAIAGAVAGWMIAKQRTPSLALVVDAVAVAYPAYVTSGALTGASAVSVASAASASVSASATSLADESGSESGSRRTAFLARCVLYWAAFGAVTALEPFVDALAPRAARVPYLALKLAVSLTVWFVLFERRRAGGHVLRRGSSLALG